MRASDFRAHSKALRWAKRSGMSEFFFFFFIAWLRVFISENNVRLGLGESVFLFFLLTRPLRN